MKTTSKLTNNSVNYNIPKLCKESVLTLDSFRSLLIVLTHYDTKNVLSHGLLSLRHDGVFSWSDTGSTELFADLTSRGKQLIRNGFDICLAYPDDDRVWFEYNLGACQYLSYGVVIPVEPCDFVLGGSK